MSDIATLQLLPVDEQQDNLNMACPFTTQTVCTVYPFTCSSWPGETHGHGFVFETGE